MPYIPMKGRYEASVTPSTPGELNFAITRLLLGYQRRHPGYIGLNDCVGALECAKAEFYRRVVVPYEEFKRTENGDVYPS